MPHLDPTHVAMLMALAGKAFLCAADSMPPPPDHCNFWCRWGYDFIQRIASNTAKVGTTQVNVPEKARSVESPKAA